VLGALPSGAAFRGTIRRVRFYKRALSPAEFQQQAQACQGMPSMLVANGQWSCQPPARRLGAPNAEGRLASV
jgi:hypothetical protein